MVYNLYLLLKISEEGQEIAHRDLSRCLFTFAVQKNGVYGVHIGDGQLCPLYPNQRGGLLSSSDLDRALSNAKAFEDELKARKLQEETVKREREAERERVREAKARERREKEEEARRVREAEEKAAAEAEEARLQKEAEETASKMAADEEAARQLEAQQLEEKTLIDLSESPSQQIPRSNYFGNWF